MLFSQIAVFFVNALPLMASAIPRQPSRVIRVDVEKSRVGGLTHGGPVNIGLAIRAPSDIPAPAPSTTVAAAPAPAPATPSTPPSNPFDSYPTVCQTTVGSPLLSDCQQIDLSTAGLCTQGAASGCQTVALYGSCALALCGPDGSDYCFYDQGTLEGMAQVLLDSCPNSSLGLVGGYITDSNMDGGGYINVEFVHT